MFLVFDTETSGFPTDGLPFDHPAQARIVQLAFVVLDEKLNEVMSYKSLIKPNGKWKIPVKVQEIHGFSEEHCQKYGVDISVAMSAYSAAHLICKHKVAHNLQFDRKMIVIESAAVPIHMGTIGEVKDICTMQLMTPVCKIQHLTRVGFKWPKLSEAYEYVTGKKLQNAHDALADVRGCVEILKWLIDNRHVTVS